MRAYTDREEVRRKNGWVVACAGTSFRGCSLLLGSRCARFARRVVVLFTLASRIRRRPCLALIIP
jgi:hypothetical protein